MHTLTTICMLILGHFIPLSLAIPTAPSKFGIDAAVPFAPRSSPRDVIDPSVPRSDPSSSIASDPPADSQNWTMTSMNVHFMGPTNNWFPGAPRFNTTLEFNLDLGGGFKIVCRANWTQGNIPMVWSNDKPWLHWCEDIKNGKTSTVFFVLQEFGIGSYEEKAGEAAWRMTITRLVEVKMYVPC